MIGAGADDLILLVARTFLAPGRTAALRHPDLPAVRGRDGSGLAGAELRSTRPSGGDLVWVCNPNNPTGELVPPEEVAALAAQPAGCARRRRRGLLRVRARRRRSCRCLERRTWSRSARLSKAFGFAALRVGYAVASARDRGRARGAGARPRRSRAPRRGSPRPRCATRVLDVEQTSPSASGSARRCSPPASTAPSRTANFVFVPGAVATARRVSRCAGSPTAFRMTIRLACAENDRLLAALGAETEPSPRRSALVDPHDRRDLAARLARLDGLGRPRVAPGSASSTTCWRSSRSTAGSTSTLLAGGRPRRRRAPHGRGRDRRARRRARAGARRPRRADAVRLGDVPMDEARGRGRRRPRAAPPRRGLASRRPRRRTR